MRVVVQHRSRYHYPRPALLGPQLIRLRPADHTRARIESYQLLVEPEHRPHWLRDPHGNRVARVTFKARQAVSELDVLVELAVEINAINPFDFFIDDRARKVRHAPLRTLAQRVRRPIRGERPEAGIPLAPTCQSPCRKQPRSSRASGPLRQSRCHSR